MALHLVHGVQAVRDRSQVESLENHLVLGESSWEKAAPWSGNNTPIPSTPPVLAVPQTQRNLNLGQKLNWSLHRSWHSPGWQKTSILTNLRDDSPGKWGCINKREIHPTVNASRSCKHSSGPTGTKKIRHYFSGTRILCQTKLFITAQAFNSSPGSKV